MIDSSYLRKMPYGQALIFLYIGVNLFMSCKSYMHKFTVPLLLIFSLSGCTAMQVKDLFSGYAQQMGPVRSAQQSGDFKKAASLVAQIESSQNNYALSLLEKGRLHFLDEDWKASREDFERAYAKVEEEQAKAKIRLSRGLANATALVSNDSVIDYQVPAYEQSMLHTYQALNYLFLGDLEGALVEIRRANLVQENALRENQDELQDAESKFNQEALKANYPAMDALIGDIKNGFQNAYTFYLSGLMYEAASQPNDAYIDYKRALEIYPNNRYLQQDVLRLANKLGMSDDLTRFTQQYGSYTAPESVKKGQVVIVLEQGVINHKDELTVNLPIFTHKNDMRFYSFSLPVYQGGLVNNDVLQLSMDDKNYRSEEIVRLQSLASKQLQEQLPELVTRQALRVVAKEQLRQTMSKEGGTLGNILASIYNVASEHADTRSWTTLPDEVQIIRLPAAVGLKNLQLKIGNQSLNLDVEIKADRITFINLISIGNNISHKVSVL